MSNSSTAKLAASSSLALALMALQFASIGLAESDAFVRAVLPATIAGVIPALWPLRGRIGVWVIYVGLAANLCAIVANGGLMPIERSTIVEAIGEERAAEYETGRWIEGSKDVLVDAGSGRLVALGDGIIVRIGARGFAASPGDLVIWAGVALLAAEASLAWQRGRRTERVPEYAPPKAEGSATTPQ